MAGGCEVGCVDDAANPRHRHVRRLDRSTISDYAVLAVGMARRPFCASPSRASNSPPHCRTQQKSGVSGRRGRRRRCGRNRAGGTRPCDPRRQAAIRLLRHGSDRTHKGSVWKRQPFGGLIGLGTSPFRMMRCARRRRAPARAPRTAAPACRDAAACAKTPRLGASSTILPRYITATRWVMCSTIARSCR